MYWINETPAGKAVKSYIKVFVAVVLGLFLADGADVFSVDATDLKTWLAAGFAAVLPLVVTALDPTDSRFGATESVDPEVFDEASYNGE